MLLIARCWGGERPPVSLVKIHGIWLWFGETDRNGVVSDRRFDLPTVTADDCEGGVARTVRMTFGGWR